MQTLTISRNGGRSNYTLSPTRNTGELQDKLAKCNGKSRKSAIRDMRTKGNFPKFEAGMSTADYVRLFESLGTPCKPVEWAQLNSEPCTLYSGEDTCETLPDGFETWEDFDAAQGSSTAAESAPAYAEPVDAAEPVAPDDAIAPAIVASAEPGAPAPSARAEPYPGCEPQRMADPLATHSEPAPDRPVYANDYLAWRDVENGRAEPDEYQARVIECFGEVKAGGLFYNSDTYPATAALMTERYGYPDWRGDRGQSDGVQDPFGMDCYRANCVIRARAERERERSAAATFTVGQRFARLIFNDGKQRTAAELVTLDPAGFACKIKAKSGRNSVEVTCSAYALSMAVIRAEERGKALAAKRARALPEPIAPMPAEPAPVPGKSEPAADPFDAWQAAPNDPKPTFGAYTYAKGTGRTVVAFTHGGRGDIYARDAGMRYVHRAKGFVGTPKQAEKMRAAWLAGAMHNAERAKASAATPGSLRAMLESLAVPTHAPLPGDTKPEAPEDDETIPAPLDGLDVAELGDDGMTEFERATREQATAPAYRELTTAHYRPQGPCLRIPAFDARAMIPQRFAPVYLLQS